MNIKIMKMYENSPLPKRATDESAGLDLLAFIENEIILNPGDHTLIPTGIKIELPQGYAAFIYARSGLAIKHGIIPSNCVGVIDSDYRGEILVGLINSHKEVYKIKPLERIAQMVITKIEIPDIEISENLSKSVRDIGGFGSTGKL